MAKRIKEIKRHKKEIDWTRTKYSPCLIGFFKIKHKSAIEKKESQGQFIDCGQIKKMSRKVKKNLFLTLIKTVAL
jgi:hypothetical protein